MSVVKRVKCDLSPAFLMLLAVWATSAGCASWAEGDLPRSVASASNAGILWCVLWWLRSDSVRRGEPLLLVWGLGVVFLSWVYLPLYLFQTRGAWAFFTIGLYLVLFALAGAALLLAY